MHLLVVGGDSAVKAAVGVARQEGNRVTISYRKSTFARVKKKNEERMKQLISEKKFRPLFNSNALEISDKTVRPKAEEDAIEIPNDYVFIFIGGEPLFKMLQDMGVAFGGEARPLGLKA